MRGTTCNEDHKLAAPRAKPPHTISWVVTGLRCHDIAVSAQPKCSESPETPSECDRPGYSGLRGHRGTAGRSERPWGGRVRLAPRKSIGHRAGRGRNCWIGCLGATESPTATGSPSTGRPSRTGDTWRRWTHYTDTRTRPTTSSRRCVPVLDAVHEMQLGGKSSTKSAATCRRPRWATDVGIWSKKCSPPSRLPTPRDRPPETYPAQIKGSNPDLLRHRRRLERTHRGRERGHRDDAQGRPRHPRLRELPPTSPARRRWSLAMSTSPYPYSIVMCPLSRRTLQYGTKNRWCFATPVRSAQLNPIKTAQSWV